MIRFPVVILESTCAQYEEICNRNQCGETASVRIGIPYSGYSYFLDVIKKRGNAIDIEKPIFNQNVN